MVIEVKTIIDESLLVNTGGSTLHWERNILVFREKVIQNKICDCIWPNISAGQFNLFFPLRVAPSFERFSIPERQLLIFNP